MLKTFFKLLLSVIVYTVVFVLANALLPFSSDFKELGASGQSPLSLLFLMINSAWVCFTIYFIIRHTHFKGVRLFLNLLFIFFFVQHFMTQIETLFFGHSFAVLTKLDIIYIMLAGLFPLMATTPLLIKFFKNDAVEAEIEKPNITDTLLRLGLIGVIYLFVYMLFGYFVAWQFEELRVFYSGTATKMGFWEHIFDNLVQTNPVIFPFQIVRGILFGLFILPLRNMINQKKTFVTSVSLVYLGTAILLIIPNVLFPDTVRLAHLLEMTTSMLLFGVIVGILLWKRQPIHFFRK